VSGATHGEPNSCRTGADSFESGGCNECQSFRDWDIGHDLTVCLLAPRLRRFAGGQNLRRGSYLEVRRKGLE
jgi:hypothetical protein